MCWYQKTSVYLVLLGGLTQPLHASPESDDLTQRLNQIHSLSADFNQKLLSEGQSIARSKGHLSLLKPNRFRWMIDTPSKQLILADGKEVWVYDIELEQVTIKPQNQALKGTPALFLSESTQEVMREYQVQHLSKEAHDIYELTAHSERPAFKKITFEFVKQQLYRMILIDRLAQKTELTFNHVIQNQSIPLSQFSVSLPRGTDVIRE